MFKTIVIMMIIFYQLIYINLHVLNESQPDPDPYVLFGQVGKFTTKSTRKHGQTNRKI